jgi:hypothetical protein
MPLDSMIVSAFILGVFVIFGSVHLLGRAPDPGDVGSERSRKSQAPQFLMEPEPWLHRQVQRNSLSSAG